MFKTISIIKTLLRTLASRSAVSESPKHLQVPGLDVILGRETPCGLVKKDLNTSEDHGFTLPENIKEAFGEKDFKWVEYNVSTAGFEVSFLPSLIFLPAALLLSPILPVSPSLTNFFLSFPFPFSTTSVVPRFLLSFMASFFSKDTSLPRFGA